MPKGWGERGHCDELPQKAVLALPSTARRGRSDLFTPPGFSVTRNIHRHYGSGSTL